MARKQIKVSRGILITWFVLAGFIFLFTPQKITNKFQLGFAHIFRWPLRIGRGVSLSARTASSPEQTWIQKETRYQNHITDLHVQLQQAYSEVDRLSGLRNRLPLEGAKLTPAGITMASSGNWADEFIINRGENEQIAVGQFVLGDNCIIGEVSEVWLRTAKVRLITNSDFSTAVKVAGLSGRVLMQGDGRGAARILSRNKVETGSKVIADRKAGFLDVGMIIGKVVDCKRDESGPLLWEITVGPACRIESLTDVAVIIMNPQ